MTGITETSENSGATQVTLVFCVGLLVSSVLSFPSPGTGSRALGDTTSRRLQILLAAFSIPVTLAIAWLNVVNARVPQPYLDEVFHIPQAQVYCAGNYTHWDDKITTPPGLYALSILLTSTKLVNCSVETLRSANVVSIGMTALMAIGCRALIEQLRPGAEKQRFFSPYAVHTGVNIALFPVLFFFSGLYYTDVLSTCVVLGAYYHHLERLKKGQPNLLDDFGTILLGVLALFMRQTNVFWVVVYIGGLEAVHALKGLRPEHVPKPHHTTLVQELSFYAYRYSVGDIHDPSLNIAWPDDFIVCVISLAIAAICNPFRVLRQIWPHLSVLGLFGAFVYWNGGVVLGDKSNHVATLHLAQMLYIWPLFAFFSAPLFIPQLLNVLSFFLRPILAKLRPNPSHSSASNTAKLASSSQGSARQGGGSKKASKNRPVKQGGASELPSKSQALEAFLLIGSASLLHLFIRFAVFLAISLLIVRYNTLIHPFTLADNRHYMFYVFRYTILRSAVIRYLLVIAYTVSRWMSWTALEGCAPQWLATSSEICPTREQKEDWICSPFDKAATHAMATRPQNGKSSKLNSNAGGRILGLEQPQTAAPSSSTVVILFLATALSLISAPLVEPRYFILPWVCWRLLVPAWSCHECEESTSGRPSLLDTLPGGMFIRKFGQFTDLRLWLETAWFLLINALTMYMFIARPYYWKSPDGELLDDGRLQRFMW